MDPKAGAIRPFGSDVEWLSTAATFATGPVGTLARGMKAIERAGPPSDIEGALERLHGVHVKKAHEERPATFAERFPEQPATFAERFPAAEQPATFAERFPAETRRTRFGRQMRGGELDAAAPRVSANGKLAVDVNAPRNVRVTAEGGGVFNKTETTRQLEPMAEE
jgi:hypothetical protein